MYFFGLGLQESEMDVFRQVMVSLVGWVNQQSRARDRLLAGGDPSSEALSRRSLCEGRLECRERLGGLLRYYLPGCCMNVGDSSFRTLRGELNVKRGHEDRSRDSSFSHQPVVALFVALDAVRRD